MSAQIETFLARLYTDPVLLEAFLASPAEVAGAAGLAPADAAAMNAADLTGLRMAALSFARKRASHRPKRRTRLQRLRHWLLCLTRQAG